VRAQPHENSAEAHAQHTDIITIFAADTE